MQLNQDDIERRLAANIQAMQRLESEHERKLYSLSTKVEQHDSAIHDLKARKVEQLPGYAVWRNELNQSIAGIIKKEIDNIDSRIATQAELNLTNQRLYDMEAKFTAFMKKSSADIIDIKSKFDIESLKQMFVTKQAPDNALKRLADCEILCKGVKTVDNRLNDLEKDLSNLKANQVSAATIDSFEERLAMMEYWRPFLSELDNKKIFDLIAQLRFEQQQLVDAQSYNTMKESIFKQINDLFVKMTECKRDYDDLRRILEQKPDAEPVVEEDDDLSKLRKMVKMILNEHIKENILRQIRDEMKAEALNAVRDSMKEHVALAMKQNSH